MGSPQTVRLTSDASGVTTLLVIGCDYVESTSWIDVFRDTTGDGVPNAVSKTTLVSSANAHFTKSALDRATGTLYVADMLNDRVLRFADTSGDLVPDAASTTFWQGTPS